MTDKSRLEDLARRVADGEPVDWEVEERRSADPEYLQTIRNLKRLAGVAGLQPDRTPDGHGDRPTATYQDDSLPEGRIGPYRLLQKVGEGGMGEVWEAEQEEPVRRRVALKLIKWGMDTKQVVARFESERQALALMDHPGIAKVFDAGATEKGRPYFVMEYVKGVPINQYCDTHRLTTEERLKLFRQVCDAAQHAHHKAIIHRDLKPSNVLVTEQDGKRQPKIIDFGIAKATAQKLTEKTLFTELGALIGTPEYMSPEQAELTGEDVDTRTDVYSLGVILYELLVGALPFDPKELRSAGFEGIRKKIREEEPHKPSTRFSTLGDAATESARARQVDPSTLERQLRGDLDWLTMRALEKDRTRRYGSPMELAADIGRYLEDEPVLASPPSAAYRAGKFVRRHRVGVVAALIVLLALVVGIAGTTIGLVRATRAEAEARMEAATAEQVSDFLVDLFKVSDPGEARGNSITAREILDKGAATIEAELGDQPLVQARLQAVIGWVYLRLGLWDQAEPLFLGGLETHRRLLGDDHASTRRSMKRLGLNYYSQGEYEKSEALLQEALAASRRLLGDEHEDTLSIMTQLAPLYGKKGLYKEAEKLHRESYEILVRTKGPEHAVLSMMNLAICLKIQGRYKEAEKLHREALEIRRDELGDDHPHTVLAMFNLAITLMEDGRYQEAEEQLRATIESQSRVLGEKHPDTLLAIAQLANVHSLQRRHGEAEALCQQAFEGMRHTLGHDHVRTLSVMKRLVTVQIAAGHEERARPLAREIISIFKANTERPDASTDSKYSYAQYLLTCEVNDLRDPETALEYALQVSESADNGNAKYLDTLALAYYRTGQTKKAMETEERAIALLPQDDHRLEDFRDQLSEFKASHEPPPGGEEPIQAERLLRQAL